jgi:hypothetical protein
MKCHTTWWTIDFAEDLIGVYGFNIAIDLHTALCFFTILQQFGATITTFAPNENRKRN